MLVQGWSVAVEESISRWSLNLGFLNSHAKTYLLRVEEWYLETMRWENLGRMEAARTRHLRVEFEMVEDCVSRSSLNKIICQYLKNIRSYCTKKRPGLQRHSVWSLGARKLKSANATKCCALRSNCQRLKDENYGDGMKLVYGCVTKFHQCFLRFVSIQGQWQWNDDVIIVKVSIDIYWATHRNPNRVWPVPRAKGPQNNSYFAGFR